MQIIKDLLKNPPSKYRPVPFWSWNTKLDTEETKWQINEMKNAGMGGFFMHARGGLTTPYLGSEWMDNVRESVNKAKELDMHAWGYDENGWPSGFGSDAVNGLGVEYQQKYLRMEYVDCEKSSDTTITNISLPDGRIVHFYYDVNPFYVDTLNGAVTDEFLKSTHEKYKEELGKDFKNMEGFFTDEPQVSRNGIPWSFILCDEYKKAYDDELLPKLYDLFEDTETGSVTRFRFWKLVTYLFSENFMGRIYKWCNENGVMLTGHMVLEEGPTDGLESNGAIMPNYEYMHIPGVDKLGQTPNKYLTNPQIVSVCAQLGKKQILTESFACCGWDVTFEELKHVYEWQMVKGINLLCQHLAGYSLEGLRKRDYPAGHFYQNPWWKDYNDFNDFAARMGVLLSEGEIKCDVLVLHPMASAWVKWYGDDKRVKLNALQDAIFGVLSALDENQIIYHLGDDKIMAKYASVDNGNLTVGKMSYSTVIVPPSTCLDSNTLSLITEFQNQGGNLIFIGEIAKYIDGKVSKKASELCKVHVESATDAIPLIPDSAKYCKLTDDNGKTCDIQVCRRVFDDFEMFYFVNTFADKTNTTIELNGKSAACFDYLTGETVPVCFTEKDGVITINHTFEKAGSVVFFVRNDDKYKSADKKIDTHTPINSLLKGKWEIKATDNNVISLDRCDVYFDGDLVEKNAYVLDIQQLACDLKRKVRVAMDFDVNFDRRPVDRIHLVIERPENYTIYINGKLIEKKDIGYYRDKSFRMIDVTGLFEIGYNILTLECNFVQSQEVYDTLDNCCKFESVKNKLYYDMEIEPVYLVGEFAVNSDKDFTPCEINGIKTGGKFSLTKRPFNINDGDIAPQGFPFFCGSMTLSKTFLLSAEELQNRSVEFSNLCSIITKVKVNGMDAGNICWAPYSVNLDGLLHEGENEIEIELITSFQNMLGPHHMGSNEKFCYPPTFHKNSRIWGNPQINSKWDDAYSFSKVGIFLR